MNGSGSPRPAEAAPPDPLLIVGGAPRSGTTLLRNMLNAHPLIAVPGESYFILHVFDELASIRRTGDPVLAWDLIRRHPFFLRWDLDPGAVESLAARHPPVTYADLIRVVFAAYAASQGKSLSVDKTPWYAMRFGILAEMLPTTRFVHLLRDPREVCMSGALQVWHKDLWAAADIWARTVAAVASVQDRLGERLIEVRYEELVRKPEQELRRICSHAGVEFDDAILDYPRSRGLLAGAAYRRARQPLRAGARRWQDELSHLDIALIESRCGRLMDAAGYPRITRGLDPRARAIGLGRGLEQGLEHLARVRCGAALGTRPETMPPADPDPRPWPSPSPSPGAGNAAPVLAAADEEGAEPGPAPAGPEVRTDSVADR
ncbi:MAG: sulfotransferase family protein [Actinomycetota bacterium]